jgi:molybdopterin biosynthesis enzyme
VLASDVIATTQWPPQSVATRDGWAVSSEHVLDASAYTPVLLDSSARWIEIGESLPAQADAVLRADDVVQTQAGPEASAPVTAGEGVAGAGAEIAKGLLLRRAGQRLRASDAAVLVSCGMNSVAVRRPTVCVVSISVPAFAAMDNVSPLVLRVVEDAGGAAKVVRSTNIEEALRNERMDAVIAIGGTGAGRRDASVDTLAHIGNLVWHGLGIAPGESGALGVVQGRPALLLPGRFDAALAALLMVGTALLDRLTGRREAGSGRQEKLTRKVTSTIGLTEIMLLRRVSDGVEPLAAGALTLQALAQADGWGVIAPESEGLPAGSMVEIRPLP